MSGTQILQPKVSIALASAQLEVTNAAQRALIVGQQITGGTGVDGVINENIASSGAPEDALYVRNSMLAAMVRAFKLINPLVRVDGLPLDDAAGAARVVDITIVGTATEAGTLIVVAGSETLHKYSVAVASADDATAIAAAIMAVVNADDTCPFTASVLAGVVSLTADNMGTVANDLGVECSGTIAGVTGQAVSETTPGATDPTLTGILDVATDRYQTIVWPYADVSVLKAFLDARFNPSNQIMDGVGFVTANDTHANHLTRLDTALNSPSVVEFCDKDESETNYLGPAQNEPSYSKSAMFAAIRALRMTPDASISRYVTSPASLDQFGGVALASLPFFNTPMPQMPVISSGRGWTYLEIEQLLAAGGSVLGVNASGEGALVGEVVTTYLTDGASNPDPTFTFLNYVDTASAAREYFFNNYKARFAQSRLTEGAVSRGRDMANGTIIRAYGEKLYQDLAGPDYTLVQDGEAAFVYFKENQMITLDLSLGKVTITMLVPIVTQLRTIICTMRISFSTEG